jgi:hypothetical protein
MMTVAGTLYKLYKTIDDDLHVPYGAHEGTPYVWIPPGEIIFVVATSEYYTLFLWNEKVFRTASRYAEESQCWEQIDQCVL